MKFLGKDPDSLQGQSPAIWDNGDSYVIQGFRITDATVLAEVGKIPEHETVVEIPKRLTQFFPEGTGRGGAHG